MNDCSPVSLPVKRNWAKLGKHSANILSKNLSILLKIVCVFLQLMTHFTNLGGSTTYNFIERIVIWFYAFCIHSFQKHLKGFLNFQSIVNQIKEVENYLQFSA